MFTLLFRFGPKPKFLRRLLIDSIGREQISRGKGGEVRRRHVRGEETRNPEVLLLLLAKLAFDAADGPSGIWRLTSAGLFLQAEHKRRCLLLIGCRNPPQRSDLLLTTYEVMMLRRLTGAGEQQKRFEACDHSSTQPLRKSSITFQKAASCSSKIRLID